MFKRAERRRGAAIVLSGLAKPEASRAHRTMEKKVENCRQWKESCDDSVEFNKLAVWKLMDAPIGRSNCRLVVDRSFCVTSDINNLNSDGRRSSVLALYCQRALT